MAKFHSNKEISQAIEYAIEQGWRFEMGGSHCYGKLYCPHNQRGGCIVKIHSTPRSRENHAKNLIAEINDCPHCPE